MQIIKDMNPLKKNYVPSQILDRDQQKSYFEFLVLDPIRQGSVPEVIYCYGGTGTGKSATLRRLFIEHMPEIKRRIPKTEYVYVNAGDLSTPSFYALLDTLNRKHLSKYLPIQSIRRIPVRGWDTNNQLSLTKSIITKEKLNLILIVDEVDKLVKYKYADEPNRAFRVFTRNNQLGERGGIGIATVFITNDINLTQYIPREDRDRMNSLSFERYDYETLFQILKYHAEMALEKGAYTEGDLHKITKWEYENGRKSARELKEILQYTCYYSEQKGLKRIDTTDLTIVYEQMEEANTEREIMAMPEVYRIILLATIKRGRIAKRTDRSKKIGLKPYILYPTGRLIYYTFKQMYKELKREKPIAYRTFYRKIQDLERDGFLMLDVTSLGKARGRTTLISTPAMVKTLEPKIKESLEIE